MARLTFLFLVLFCCGLFGSGCNDERRFYGDDDDDDGSDSDSDSDTDSSTDSDSDTDADTDSYTGPDYDCDNLPSAPVAFNELANPRGYHDVAFDHEGHIVGSDGTGILKVTSDDELADVVTGVGWAEGMDYLPNGDLVVADSNTGSLLRIDSEGVSTPIANSIYAYGVTIGPLGRVYAANNSALYRVDPNTTEVVTYVNPSSGFSPRVVNFSPDHSRLYFVTFDGYGEIYYIDLDEDMDPIGNPVLLASGAGGTYMDGLGVDACGNLYVPVYDNHTMYRVSPEGAVEVFYTWPDLTPYGHGLEWGTGQDGWSITALYLPQPYDMSTVLEMEIGVPSRIWADND